MTTVRDAVAAAEPAAAADFPPETPPDSPGAVRARDARAKVPATDGDVKASAVRSLLANVRSDWDGAWWWDARPETVAELVARRKPHPDTVPDGSKHLRWAWAVYNHLIAIPVTWALLPIADRLKPRVVRQLARGLVWMFQHPTRTGLGLIVAGPVLAMWIAF